MNIQGVLVEHDSQKEDEVYSTSGLLFSDFVLITGHIVTPYLKNQELTKVINSFPSGKLISDLIPPDIKRLQFKIVKESTAHGGLQIQKSQIAAAFICANIARSCRNYLSGWTVAFEDEKYASSDLLPIFFVLQVVNSSGDLTVALRQLLDNAEKQELAVGQEVFIESTPFGNRVFIQSYSQGIISNLVGEERCLFLTDSPSVPGSEGSPVFTKAKEKVAVGIVICCLHWCRGEWVGLTLGASLAPLLKEVVTPTLSLSRTISLKCNISPKLAHAASTSLVQIASGSVWGTGILIDKSQGVFLTNSHVITSDYDTTAFWRGMQTKARVLYQTPNAEVYDLAVLQCDRSKIRNWSMQQVKLSVRPAQIGEEVVAAGYPLFPPHLSPQPTITRGHVSQARSYMIKTTCSVLAGCSGGAVFRPGGELLAVVVSNTKMGIAETTYPHVNMAIPILAVKDVFQEYQRTTDAKTLRKLHSQDPTVYKEWNYLNGKL